MDTDGLGVSEAKAEWHRELRNAAQHKVDEPVLAGGLFARLGAQTPLGPFSGIAALVANGIGRRRASGLPRQFAIAVTPTAVHAFEILALDGAIELGEEVASWRRAGLIVSAEATATRTKVAIESAASGERVICATGNDALSRSVVSAMQEPVAAPA